MLEISKITHRWNVEATEKEILTYLFTMVGTIIIWLFGASFLLTRQPYTSINLFAFHFSLLFAAVIFSLVGVTCMNLIYFSYCHRRIVEE